MKKNNYEYIKNEKLFKFADIFLIIILILVLSLTTVILFKKNDDGNKVKIMLEGKIYGTYDLARDNNIEVTKIDNNGKKRCLLKVIIHNKEVKVIESTCPDHLCEYGSIKYANSSIICLPNKVVVTIENSKDKGVLST